MWIFTRNQGVGALSIRVDSLGVNRATLHHVQSQKAVTAYFTGEQLLSPALHNKGDPQDVTCA